jgi:hypothetical protein
MTDTTSIDDTTDDQPPAEAERFVYVGRELRADYESSWAEDPHYDEPRTLLAGSLETFRSGDDLPRPLVLEVWERRGAHEIVALDGDGVVVAGAADPGEPIDAQPRDVRLALETWEANQ